MVAIRKYFVPDRFDRKKDAKKKIGISLIKLDFGTLVTIVCQKIFFLSIFEFEMLYVNFSEFSEVLQK